jgi:hypothetical protein
VTQYTVRIRQWLEYEIEVQGDTLWEAQDRADTFAKSQDIKNVWQPVEEGHKLMRLTVLQPVEDALPKGRKPKA